MKKIIKKIFNLYDETDLKYLIQLRLKQAMSMITNPENRSDFEWQLNRALESLAKPKTDEGNGE